MSDKTLHEQLAAIQAFLETGRKREIETAKLLRCIHQNLDSIRNAETLTDAKQIATVTQIDMNTHLFGQIEDMNKEKETKS